MSLDLIIHNPLNDRSWDEMLLKTENFSIFHTSSWAKVLSESYNYKPKYFVYYENESMVLVWPFMEISSYLTGKRGVSLPFTDYCQPLYSGKIKIEDVVKNIIDFGKGTNWKYIEFRGGDDAFNQSHNSLYYLHSLDLSKGNEKLFASIHNTTKRNINKAKREGVQVNISHSLKSVKEYYHLHCLTRKRHGLPPQPFYFFKSIFIHIISKDLGFVVLAHVKDKCIAGAMYFHFGDKAVYKYGASDMNHQNLRPNNLVMWEAIKWYASNEYKNFSFGRTDYYHEGLRRFKNSWGTNESVIKYYRYDVVRRIFYPEDKSKSNTIQNLYKRMPIFASKIIGNILYKHVG